MPIFVAGSPSFFNNHKAQYSCHIGALLVLFKDTELSIEPISN